MNLNLSDYTKLLGGFSSSVFGIVFSSLVIAFVTLLILLALLFLFRKTILIKRRHIILRILSVSYFILIPLIGGLAAFKWALAKNVKIELQKNVSQYTKELDTDFRKGLEAGSAIFSPAGQTSAMQFSANSAIDRFSDGVYEEYIKVLEKADSGTENLAKKTATLILRITKGKAISYAIKTGIKKLTEDKIGLDQDVTEQAMDLKFTELVNDGLFSKILNIQIDHFFSGIQKGIIVTFCIILLFPLMEIGIAYWLYQKNKGAVINIPAA